MKETDGIEWKEGGRCKRVGKKGAAAAIKEEKKGGVEGDGGGSGGVTMFIASTACCCNQHQCFTGFKDYIQSRSEISQEIPYVRQGP